MSKFSDLENIEEMFAFFGEEKDNTAAELMTLNMQVFLVLFGKYLSLDEETQRAFQGAFAVYTDPKSNPLVQTGALALMTEALTKDMTSVETEVTRSDKVYNTPCEDCENIPTHLIEFHKKGRSEKHYLCEGCQKDIEKNTED